MRIGLNLLYLIPGRVGGTQTYGVSLIKALAAIDRSNEYFIFLNREGAALELPLPCNFHVIQCPFRGSHRLNRYAWEQFVLPFQLKSLGIDVLHSLGYVGPLMSPCPAVVTIPDINFIALKNDLPLIKRMILRFFSSQSARGARRVITISHISKNGLVAALKLKPTKITVTHLGPGNGGPDGDGATWKELAALYSIQKPYIVAFGGGALHKNIPRLIEAYHALQEEFPHQLVILGHLPANVDLERAMNEWRLQGRLVTTGYIPEAHLQPVLQHAACFVLPSLYEGFGLPILEAQQAGVPVLCSTAASLPEVAGAGAMYFDPYSVPNLVNAMRRCLTDAEIRLRLSVAGKANLHRFSWEKTARETLEVYQSVCESKPFCRSVPGESNIP